MCGSRIASPRSRRPTASRVRTDKGDFDGAALVLATGGLSIPKMGATGFAHDIARRFGLEITADAAGAGAVHRAGAGAGAACRCRWRRAAARRRSARPCCSPIAACRARRSCRSRPTGSRGRRSSSTCCPTSMPQQFLKERKQRAAKGRAADAPGRGAAAAPRAAVPETTANSRPRPIAATTGGITPTGTEGYAKAEVTLGGVDTDELSSRTMEARKVPGLFVIGEAVDVTGWLGGYNFQWAWSSGWAAGEAVELERRCHPA